MTHVKIKRFDTGQIVTGRIVETNKDHAGRVYYKIAGDDGIMYSRYATDFLIPVPFTKPTPVVDSTWIDQDGDVDRKELHS